MWVDSSVPILSATTLMEPIPVPRLVSDPDDDVIVGTAIAAKADSIVTGYHALVALAEYRGIRIITAKEALGILCAT